MSLSIKEAYVSIQREERHVTIETHNYNFTTIN